ncbi:hypothetical protein JW721_01705 [Candidatus Micrarchaeota archaeon]|nr:hypothetical protein [Candidatus Micrarchaeota archaeon]
MGNSGAPRSCADELSDQLLSAKAYDGDVGALSSMYIRMGKSAPDVIKVPIENALLSAIQVCRRETPLCSGICSSSKSPRVPQT